MLNLPIAMKRFCVVFSLVVMVCLVFGLTSAAAQSYQLVRISSPQTGDVLQGQISIIGTSQIDGFASAEVEFSYAETNRVWYLLKSSQEAVADDELAVWDTTTITDGNYTLRLTVHMQDGRTLTYEVEELRVRNYTSIETPTVASGSFQYTPAPATATAIPLTPTSRPTVAPNPAAVSPVQYGLSLFQGAAVVLVLFIGFGLYFFLRRRFIGH